MRFVQVAGRGLCLAAVGAALVAVIISGVSALSYGQNDGALVAAFFGALVALVGSVWVCARFFNTRAQTDAPAQPSWYAGQPRAAAAPSVLLPPLAPRSPNWGPYRATVTASEAAPAPALEEIAHADDEPEVLEIGDTRKIIVAASEKAGDTRPMRAIKPDASTRRAQPAPRPVTPPQDGLRPVAPPPFLPESTAPLDVDPPVRPTRLAL